MRVQSTSGVAGRNKWPDAVTFREAIQTPSVVLGDPDLKGATVATDRLGMPLAYTGRFAVVFRLRTSAGDWAVRCFTHNANAADRRRRYTAIGAHIENLPECFVSFRYQNQGIQVAGQWYPVVAMRWAEGEPLGRFVERHHRNPLVMRRLADSLSWLLERLEKAGIAHGDWQHDNILVSGDGTNLTLVDYDGMYVPDLAGLESTEVGHPNYQHPARTKADFGVGMDRFSCLALRTALLALARDPSLWDRFSDGESILFSADDYRDPARSPVFAAIAELTAGDIEFTESLDKLVAACLTPVDIERPAAAVVSNTQIDDAETPWWLDNGAVKRTPGAPRKREAAIDVQAVAEPSKTEVLVNGLLAEEPSVIERSREQVGFAFITALILSGVALTISGIMALALVMVEIPVISLFVSYLYDQWPRRRAYNELIRRTRQVNDSIVAGGRRLQRLYARTGLPGGVTDEAEYVRWKLSHVPIRAVLNVPGISQAAFESLVLQRIETAADLEDHSNVADVSLPERTALKEWGETLKHDAAVQFARLITPALAKKTDREISEEIDRQELEMEAYEAERERLSLLLTQCPDSRAPAFIKRLLAWDDA